MRCGFASRDITPQLNIAMAGWSTDGKLALGIDHPLLARAFALEHGNEQLAICVVDLFSATRPVLDATVAALGDVDHGGVMLIGTHTHAGPGHIFGGTFYDAIAQRSRGFRPELARQLGEQIARTIDEARSAPVPVEVAYGQAPLWDLARNASPRAFFANPESTRWSSAGMPGHGASDELPIYRRVIDPRVKALVLRDPVSHRALAALCTFACHNTALGNAQESYNPDWNGAAIQLAQADLGAFLALAPGPGGDTNASREDLEPGSTLLHRSARLAADAIVRAVRSANPAGEGLEVRFEDAPLWDRVVNDDVTTEISRRPVFGRAALGGGQEGRSVFWRLGVAQQRQPSTRYPPHHPQHPKGTALGPLQRVIRATLTDRGLHPTQPIHQVRIGDVVWATLPGEPSVVAGWRMEQALCQATDASHVVIAGYSGDYIGYITTPEEYAEQEYEGASTLLGRNTATHFQARHVRLARGGPSSP